MPQFATISEKAPRQNATSFAPFHRELLQRKCACGGMAGATGECEQCTKKRKSTTDRPMRGVPTWDVNKALEGRVGTTGSFRGNLMHREGEYAIPARYHQRT